MTYSIVLNADFTDGTPIAVATPTKLTNPHRAGERAMQMWHQLRAKRRLQGKTLKTIAPPIWWLCSDEQELGEVMDWLDAPSDTQPSERIVQGSHFLATTKKHLKQIKDAIHQAKVAKGFA